MYLTNILMTTEEIKENREFLSDIANAAVVLGGDLLKNFHRLGNKLILDVSIVEYMVILGGWAVEFATKYPHNPELDDDKQLYSEFDICWDIAVSEFGEMKIREEFKKHGLDWVQELKDYKEKKRKKKW